MVDQRVTESLVVLMLLLQACVLCSIADGSRSLLSKTGTLNDPRQRLNSNVGNLQHLNMDFVEVRPRVLGISHIDYEDPQPNVSHNAKGRSPSTDGHTNP
ncbi:hypothetical protein GOP47_0007215 [Adiantum capillus-veneris]|uniref:Uncharacterized protein n=1 Tax=Adiantum capillus-veneris TaxID=13818 RepID=A0A9D4V0V3_ADICA|nr:hypothetical protein GOP47_0007215 [Adiantum capillus-veneris]